MRVERTHAADSRPGLQGSTPAPQKAESSPATAGGADVLLDSRMSGAVRIDEGSGESTTPRPPEASDPGHCARLPLRLSPELLARIKLHAEERGETLADFCRRALVQQIGRDHLVRRNQEARQAFRDGVWHDIASRHPIPTATKETHP